MRRATAGLALIVSGVLLTGCGGGDDGGAEGKPAPSASGSEEPGGGADGGGVDKGGEVVREVTLEVRGTGKTQIAYVAGGNATEQVTLPWKKTVELSLTKAEQKVGVLVSVVPGSVPGEDGMLKPAPCTITVDGEKVDDNQDGKDVLGCKHTVK
ncbi:hypothetical protein ACG5V6_19070 [Streptomyces chitinivorans]|uniref:MmpS family membrane protein n=1 Tax=Streptomyces chitinivorans TaxID=1257027 RepID=A0ABW7HWN8_9ACTN|nr:hypothetical protein [Streptomyces chitinivorans]MDH2412459.1 hypothetical protein [Streptomyces chitinivorans]